MSVNVGVKYRQMLRRIAVSFSRIVRDVRRSRIAWLLACVHAVWFVLAIANMSPPSPALGDFLDHGGWSSATLFAGRPFHFHYESAGLKLLMLLDLPSTMAMIPPGILIGLFAKTLGLHFFERSYLDAGLMLLASTLQWLVIGRRYEMWLSQKFPSMWRQLHRFAPVLIAGLIVTASVVTPVVNERSRSAGFRHAGISFFR
jgi:hypothetical protein